MSSPDQSVEDIQDVRGRAYNACAVCGGALAPRWSDDGAFNVLDCETCGIGRTWPPPDQANGEEVFSNDDGHYARQLIDGRERWRVFGGALLDRIPQTHRYGRLLDVGSGVGLLVELASERGAAACGFDRAPAAGRVARAHGIDVRTCELGDISERDFDVVVLMHVLEHVHDPVTFLSLAASRLRDGGVVIVNVPISDGLMPRLLKRRWYGFQPAQHVHQFTRRGLNEVAVRAELKPLRLTSESLYYSHDFTLKGAALVCAALTGRLLRLGDQSTLVAQA